jgi:hypothetical protein
MESFGLLEGVNKVDENKNYTSPSYMKIFGGKSHLTLLYKMLFC